MLYYVLMADPEKILVIDDNREHVEFIRTALLSKGFLVVSAVDAVQGVMYARQERPALAICDFEMPGGDGATIYDSLRKLPETAAVPVLFVSGSVPASALSAILKRDKRTGFLGKPLRLKALLEAVELLLAGKRLNDRAQEGPLELD